MAERRTFLSRPTSGAPALATDERRLPAGAFGGGEGSAAIAEGLARVEQGVSSAMGSYAHMQEKQRRIAMQDVQDEWRLIVTKESVAHHDTVTRQLAAGTLTADTVAEAAKKSIDDTKQRMNDGFAAVVKKRGWSNDVVNQAVSAAARQQDLEQMAGRTIAQATEYEANLRMANRVSNKQQLIAELPNMPVMVDDGNGGEAYFPQHYQAGHTHIKENIEGTIGLDPQQKKSLLDELNRTTAAAIGRDLVNGRITQPEELEATRQWLKDSNFLPPQYQDSLLTQINQMQKVNDTVDRTSIEKIADNLLGGAVTAQEVHEPLNKLMARLTDAPKDEALRARITAGYAMSAFRTTQLPKMTVAQVRNALNQIKDDKVEAAVPPEFGKYIRADNKKDFTAGMQKALQDQEFMLTHRLSDVAIQAGDKSLEEARDKVVMGVIDTRPGQSNPEFDRAAANYRELMFKAAERYGVSVQEMNFTIPKLAQHLRDEWENGPRGADGNDGKTRALANMYVMMDKMGPDMLVSHLRYSSSGVPINTRMLLIGGMMSLATGSISSAQRAKNNPFPAIMSVFDPLAHLPVDASLAKTSDKNDQDESRKFVRQMVSLVTVPNASLAKVLTGEKDVYTFLDQDENVNLVNFSKAAADADHIFGEGFSAAWPSLLEDMVQNTLRSKSTVPTTDSVKMVMNDLFRSLTKFVIPVKSDREGDTFTFYGSYGSEDSGTYFNPKEGEASSPEQYSSLVTKMLNYRVDYHVPGSMANWGAQLKRPFDRLTPMSTLFGDRPSGVPLSSQIPWDQIDKKQLGISTEDLEKWPAFKEWEKEFKGLDKDIIFAQSAVQQFGRWRVSKDGSGMELWIGSKFGMRPLKMKDGATYTVSREDIDRDVRAFRAVRSSDTGVIATEIIGGPFTYLPAEIYRFIWGSGQDSHKDGRERIEWKPPEDPVDPDALSKALQRTSEMYWMPPS